MSEFRAGKVDRNKLGFSKHFAPIRSVNFVTDIMVEDLVSSGKKLVLVDVDNTLVGWKSHDIPESTYGWLEGLKGAGLQICILSNTRRPARLDRLAKDMGIPYLRGRFKPSRTMYRNALQKFGVSREEAVMIGDQLFTDILGANRTGIDAIWVKQMTSRDFIGTKVSRVGERLVRRRFHKAMSDEAAIGDLGKAEVAASRLWDRPAIRQFAKFLVVGGTSTVIDWGLTWILKYHIHIGKNLMSEDLGLWLMNHIPWPFGLYSSKQPGDAAVPIIKGFSTVVAGFNSFIFNRRWTFKIRGKENRRAHANKFVVVTIIGLLLNMGITSALDQILPGSDQHRLLFAMVIATATVTLWNFLGQKHWAFREKH